MSKSSRNGLGNRTKREPKLHQQQPKERTGEPGENQNYTSNSSRIGPGNQERTKIIPATAPGTNRGTKREPKLHQQQLQERTGEPRENQNYTSKGSRIGPGNQERTKITPAKAPGTDR